MKNIYILLITLLVTSFGFGQTVIVDEQLRDGTIPAGWAQISVSFQTSASGYARFDDLSSVLTSETFNASPYSSIDIDFDLAKFGGGGNGPLAIEYSLDNGSSWIFASNSNTPSNSSYISNTITLNNLSSTMKIRFLRTPSPSQKRLRDVIISGIGSTGPDDPFAFSATAISSSQIDLPYQENLAGNDIVIVFNTTNTFTTPSGPPPAPSNAFAGGSVLVQSTSGSATYNHIGLTENTTYYYMAYSYDGTNYSAGLSAGATTLCATPTDVSAFIASAGNTTVDLSWTNETCFDEILVVAKANSSVTAMPSGDGSAYTANATFGLGTDLGIGEFAVYKGIGTSVTVTGFTNGINYHFKVFARKGTSWSAGVNGNSIPNNILSTGNIIISEIMQNPSDVNDIAGEYFEVYNATGNPINMFGWTISDNGTDSHIITSDLIVPAYGFAVLGRNADISTNGGVIIDYEYSNFDLANNSDEIVLTNLLFVEIDRVEYDNGATFPDPNGASMIYLGSDIEDNSDGSLWGAATVAEGIDIDFGSPGINGTDQIVAYLVFVNNAWNTTPTALTGARTGLIKSNESTSFTTDVSLVDLFIKEGSDLTITSGNTLTLSTVILESVSNLYSSLILDGNIVGTVKYERYVNSTGNGRDLISPPLSGESWSNFLSSDTNATDLVDDGNTSPTTYLFGPFDKTAEAYVNYTDADAATLSSGKGYRAATDSGTTLTFTGTVPTSSVFVNIDFSGTTYPDWNLIGNPYPSYLNIFDFLNYDTGPSIKNIDILNDMSGIYGYAGRTTPVDGPSWDIITLANAGSRLMTPGQGFLVAADPADVASYDIAFDPSMRTTATGTPSVDDDFIQGRDANVLTFLDLEIRNQNKWFNTEFYFNSNSSLGSDAGYDATLLGRTAPNFALYSHLVQDNTGLPIALQALNPSDLTDVTIPLGINANQGEQVTFSIRETTLPSTVNVYLKDNIANTSTLLNTSDYIFTPNVNLNGTGRFYLHVTNSALSTQQNSLDDLSIYTNQNDKKVVIAGQLFETTTAKIYDLQGRVVSTSILETTRSQTIDVSSLSTGIYVVQLVNGTQNKTQKVILR